jgi:hypothetical protein
MSSTSGTSIAPEPELLEATVDATIQLTSLLKEQTITTEAFRAISETVNRPAVRGLAPYALRWWLYHAVTMLPKGQRLMAVMDPLDPDYVAVEELINQLRARFSVREPLDRQTRAAARLLRDMSPEATGKSIAVIVAMLRDAMQPHGVDPLHLALTARIVHKAALRHAAPAFIRDNLVKIVLRARAQDVEADRNSWDMLLHGALSERGWNMSSMFTSAIQVMTDALISVHEYGVDIHGAVVLDGEDGTPDAMLDLNVLDPTPTEGFDSPATNPDDPQTQPPNQPIGETPSTVRPWAAVMMWQLTESVRCGNLAQSDELRALLTTDLQRGQLLRQQCAVMHQSILKATASIYGEN